LRLFWSAPPQAVLMPFAQERTKRYLAVVVFIIDQAMSLDVLASICSRVIEVLKSNNVIDALGGLEVMPCIVREGKTKRVLRLSVLNHALGHAEGLSPSDLKKDCPDDGITCHIYEKGLA